MSVWRSESQPHLVCHTGACNPFLWQHASMITAGSYPPISIVTSAKMNQAWSCNVKLNGINGLIIWWTTSRWSHLLILMRCQLVFIGWVKNCRVWIRRRVIRCINRHPIWQTMPDFTKSNSCCLHLSGTPTPNVSYNRKRPKAAQKEWTDT